MAAKWNNEYAVVAEHKDLQVCLFLQIPNMPLNIARLGKEMPDKNVKNFH